MMIQPGIAVTNAHNANLLDPKSVIGVRQDYDLMFFRTAKSAEPQSAPVVMGESVVAYGQGSDGELRVAHGVVRADRGRCTGVRAFPGFHGSTQYAVGVSFHFLQLWPNLAFPDARCCFESFRHSDFPPRAPFPLFCPAFVGAVFCFWARLLRKPTQVGEGVVINRIMDKGIVK